MRRLCAHLSGVTAQLGRQGLLIGHPSCSLRVQALRGEGGGSAQWGQRAPHQRAAATWPSFPLTMPGLPACSSPTHRTASQTPPSTPHQAEQAQLTPHRKPLLSRLHSLSGECLRGEGSDGLLNPRSAPWWLCNLGKVTSRL